MSNATNDTRLCPVNTRDLSRVLGITTNYINVLVYRGALTRNADGLFDLTENVPAFIRHHEAGLKATWAVDGEAKVRLTSARARLAELKLERLWHELETESRRRSRRSAFRPVTAG